jgi:hypothetical protein
VTRTAAWLLVAGAVAFWIGAFTPPWRLWLVPLPEALAVIGAHRIAWHVINGCFVVGILLTATGLTVHAHTRPSLWATLAAASYGLAVAMFLVNLAFRHTVQVWAAEIVSSGGTVPELYSTWHRFAGLLFGFYGVLAYAAVAALGASLPGWIGRANVIGGLVLAALMLGDLPPASAPLMVHLGPGVAGLLFLRR